MSSAGLIYKYYGQEIINNICVNQYKKTMNEDELKNIHDKIYQNLIMEIDCIDNGVN